ncbi:MAG: Uma2 family endonuclease [Pirellulaceae bacterium]|nr:Uma2 family endonuclease [Planctomycetales bacterium]
MATIEQPASSRLRLGQRSNGMLLSPWEFDNADFEPGWRYELVYGVLIVNPSPSIRERDPNEELGRLLRNYQESHPQGAALDCTVSEQTVNIGPHRRRVDRAIWAGLGRLPHENETPTITVEFVSEGKQNQQRDYQIKRDEYRTAGVKEYWILDRFAHTFAVYHFDGGKMANRVFQRDEPYATPLLPGFVVPLTRLFDLADRWPPLTDT